MLPVPGPDLAITLAEGPEDADRGLVRYVDVPIPGPVAIAPPEYESPPVAVPATVPPRPPVTVPAPGLYDHEVDVDGRMRRWATVVPAGLDPERPVSLVVVLHGVGGRGVDMRWTGFEPMAASSQVVVAYPDGLGGAWNDGRPGADAVVGGVVDDVKFLRMMIESTSARALIEPRRVAVVGFSNGAIMAARVACELADRISAVALVGGSGWQGFDQSCRPSRPVAMLTVAGSADTVVPYGGGKVADWGSRRRGYVAPVEDFFRFWVGQNGCTSTEVGGTTRVSESRGVDCKAGSTTVRYKVNGGGHEWFRPPTFETTNAVWSFVSGRLGQPG